MSIVSFGFLIFIVMGMIIYYVLPKSWQWVELLVLSILFYLMAAVPYTIIYLVISTAVAYLATNLVSNIKFQAQKRKKIVIGAGVAAIAVNVILWFALKGADIWGGLFFGQASSFVLALPAALGMGYYTLQIIGYILDCYMGNIVPQKNPLKLFLFVCFFPQLITGPISRYSQLEGLYERHELSYENITHGAQRILWGFLKKLVLAERVGIFVNAVWGTQDIGSIYLWMAFLLYPIQMYADFSGCMDIALGTAECFGIRLPENFNNPFFSRTIQEFWQRWHITLGTWAKDYVLYPLLKSKGMIGLNKFAKKKLGKKIGKFVTTSLGMFVLWTVMGVWHGGIKYIIGVSFWYWLLLMLGELCAPALKRLNRFFKINEESFSWHLFQSVRTYIIYAVGAVFFRAVDVKQALSFLKGIFGAILKHQIHLGVLFDPNITMGLNEQDWSIILISLVLLALVGIMREKAIYARYWVDRQILPFRWFIWLAMFLYVIIYGKYGAEYNAVNFIYQAF